MKASKLLVLAILAGVVVAACGTGGSSPPASSTGSTKPKLTVGVIQEPTTLDVTAAATAAIAVALRDNVYEGLVRLGPKGDTIPALAKSWDIAPDGTQYTFHLVTASWQDGSAFTAADVKFSWDRAADPATAPPNPHRDYWSVVKSVDLVDDHTVKVSLKQYSDSWLFHMTSGSAAIVSAKTIATDKIKPVGTGPFTFKQWVHGDSITLERNDSYWGTKARLTEVVFKYFGDANALNNALKSGDIDAIGAVGGPEQLATFKGDSKYHVNQAAPSGKIMVSLNNTTGNPALKDVRVRQAITYAIDRKAWIDGVQSGYAAAIGSHSVPNSTEPYYLDLTGIYPHDTTKAKQLLSDAGYGSGLTLRLDVISSFPYAVRGAQLLVSELADVGVKVNVQQVEFALWLDRDFTKGDYDMTIINHVEPRDISNYANPKYYWHYNNAQVAQLLAQADAQPDATKRIALYQQVEKQITADAANAWVMSPDSLSVTVANLQGYPTSLVAPAIYLGQAYFS